MFVHPTFSNESKLPDSYFRWAIYFVTITTFLYPVFHCVKLLRGGNEFGAWVFYIFFPTMSLLFFFSFVLGRRMKFYLFNGMEWALILATLWALSVTLLGRGDLVDITGNLLRMVFSFTCYYTTRIYNRSEFMNWATFRLGRYGFWGVFVAVFLLYSLGVFGGMKVYLGLGTGPIFLMLSIYLIGKPSFKWFKVLLCFSLVILGGKRGMMISAALMILTYLSVFKKGIVSKFAIATIVFSALLLGTLVASMTVNNFSNYLPRPVQARILPFFGTLDRQGLDVLTAGRNIEVEAVVRNWQDEPSTFFTGRGFGATFIDVTGEENSTIHIGPVALTYIYGLPVALLLLLSVGGLVLSSLLRVSKLSDLEKIWLLCGIGALLDTLSLYTFFQDPFIWIAMGMISKPIK